jgi:hypothetical protein
VAARSKLRAESASGRRIKTRKTVANKNSMACTILGERASDFMAKRAGERGGQPGAWGAAFSGDLGDKFNGRVGYELQSIGAS